MYGKAFYCGGEVREPAAQRGSGVSILGGIQNTSRQVRGSRWLCLSRGLGLDHLQRSLPPPPFCESVRWIHGAREYEGRSLNFEHFKLSKLKLFQFLKTQQKCGFSAYRQFISADLPDRTDEYFAVVDLTAHQQVQQQKTKQAQIFHGSYSKLLVDVFFKIVNI